MNRNREFDVHEMAVCLGLKENTVMNYIYSGYFPTRKDRDGRYLAYEKDLIAFREGGKKRTVSYHDRIGNIYRWMLDYGLSTDALVLYACLYSHRSSVSSMMVGSGFEAARQIGLPDERLERAYEELVSKGIIELGVNMKGNPTCRFTAKEASR